MVCLQKALTFPCEWDEPVTCYVSTKHFNSSGSQKGLAGIAPLLDCTWLAIRWSRYTGCVAVLGICNIPKHSLQGKNPNNPRQEFNRKSHTHSYFVIQLLFILCFHTFSVCWMTQREQAQWWEISFRFVPFWLLQRYRWNNLIPWIEQQTNKGPNFADTSGFSDERFVELDLMCLGFSLDLNSSSCSSFHSPRLAFPERLGKCK